MYSVETSVVPVMAAKKAEAVSGTSSAKSSANISANDFLQLLITELKNQDPTANSDPNEYINQLVQVNSLEQLIQINEDLGGGSASSTGLQQRSSTFAGPVLTDTALPTFSSGNLSAHEMNPDASSVARALQPRSSGSEVGGVPSELVTGSILNRMRTTFANTSNPAH